MKHVQNGRGRRWNAEQKLVVLQEGQVPGWIEHYNWEAPHSSLGMQLPAECHAMWLVKNKTRPVHN